MTNYTSHNKICYACGEEKRRRQLGYDLRTLKTYCKKDCPNPSAIPAVDLVELRTEDLKEAVETYYTDEMQAVFNRILGKTVSTRPVPAMAMHLMKTAKKHNLQSISETLTFILERDFAQYEIPEHLQPEAEEVKAEVVEVEPEIVRDPITNPEPLPEPEEIKITVNEKSIEPKKKEEEADDNEFTF